MLVDMSLERIRRGSVSTEEAGVVVSDRDATVVLDARHALGQLTADQAIKIAVERARRHGVGIVAVRHGFHFGTARRYVIQAAERRLRRHCHVQHAAFDAAPAAPNAWSETTPSRSRSPTDGPIPIVLDMATSEAAMGKIRMAEKAEQTIPQSWAVKSDGSAPPARPRRLPGCCFRPGGRKASAWRS